MFKAYFFKGNYFDARYFNGDEGPVIPPGPSTPGNRDARVVRVGRLMAR